MLDVLLHGEGQVMQIRASSAALCAWWERGEGLRRVARGECAGVGPASHGLVSTADHCPGLTRAVE